MVRPLTRPVIENQILTKEIKPTREAMLLEQDGICPLCNTPILEGEGALDHCHTNGNIRMVLHRWCNSILGRVENWSKRVGKTDHLTFLKNTVEYLEKSHTDLIHPTHGVPRKRSRKRKTGTKRNAKGYGKKVKATVKRNPNVKRKQKATNK